MEIRYRKLTLKDLDTFIDIRIKQLTEEGTTSPLDLKPDLYRYFEKHLVDGTFVSYVALDGDKIIGTSGMSFVEKPPYFSNPSGKIGLISSMYTNPNYRRMGIAKTLLDKVVTAAKEYGCKTVWVTASEMGTYLYKDYGFGTSDKFLIYNF